MPTIFSKIVTGEIPCHKVGETDDFLAFLDIMPVAPGHTLVIPKQEVDYYFDLEDHVLTGLTLFAKTLAPKIETVVPCARIGVSVVGLEVPHAHVHLIPINHIGDMDFAKQRNQADHAELAKLAEAIRNA